MPFIDDLKKYMKEHEFSIDMLDYSRMCFQYGGFTDKDCYEFISMLSKKIRERLPDLDSNMDEILAILCIERGVHKIVDVYFYEDVAYSKKMADEPYSNRIFLDYIGSATTYEKIYFDYLSNILTRRNVSKEIMNKLAASLHDIFLRYFKDGSFPENLDWEEVREMNGYPYLEFAISIKEEEMANLLKQNKTFSFKIASKIKNEDNCCLVELECCPKEENFLEVVSVIDEPVKLSSLLENKKGTKKRKLT